MDYRYIIKSLRKSAKYSQDDLAAILGIKRHTICDWETGRTEPSITSLTNLSKTFNVSVDYLLCIRNDSLNPKIDFDLQKDYISFIARTTLESKLLSTIQNCTGKQQEIIQSLLVNLEEFK